MYWKVMHQCPIVELKHVGLQLSISTKSSHCKHNHTHCPDGYESWKSLAPCPQMHNINCSQCKFWHTTHQTPLLPDDLVVGPLKSIWRLLARHWCLLCRWDPPKHHDFMEFYICLVFMGSEMVHPTIWMDIGCPLSGLIMYSSASDAWLLIIWWWCIIRGGVDNGVSSFLPGIDLRGWGGWGMCCPTLAWYALIILPVFQFSWVPPTLL